VKEGTRSFLKNYPKNFAIIAKPVGDKAIASPSPLLWGREKVITLANSVRNKSEKLLVMAYAAG
jgi:hypothetical protein